MAGELNDGGKRGRARINGNVADHADFIARERAAGGRIESFLGFNWQPVRLLKVILAAARKRDALNTR